MRIATIASLGVSGVLGLAALVAARLMTPSADDHKPAIDANTQPMVVAARDIAWGQTLAAADLAVQAVPADLRPAGAYETIEAALGDKDAPVALAAIAAREVIMPARLSTGGGRASVASAIQPGKRAYAIAVTDISGVGGNALPGDRVDVVLMRDLSEDGSAKRLVSQVVIQNVRVLAIDLNADQSSTETALPKTATLEIEAADAQKLAIAGDLGELSLALRRAGASGADDAQPLTAAALPGAPAAAPRSTPVRAARPPSPAPSPSLTIVNGAQRVAVDVSAERGS